MNRQSHGQWSLALVASFLGLLLLGAQTSAQDTTRRSDGVSGAPAATPDGSTQPIAKPAFRGRLPAYFSAVVTSKQRKEIYALQAECHEKIEEMLSKIEELKKGRDKAVDGILTAEQLAAVQQKRDAAAAKRAERQAKADTTEGSER